MCGFAALFEPGRVFTSDLLAAVDADLHHRGPDSGGQIIEPGFALVFRRLSILDVREAADQPMTDPSGRYTLVFNGEIYNYRHLRAELESKGCVFRTTGDTEVLLQGFATWGEGVLDRLEGMYAFVIVDRKERVAVAARDPLGIKPLYAVRHGQTVAFASEARPLRRLLNRGVDTDALAELLLFRFAAGRLSNFSGIDRVPPGSAIRVSLDNGNYRERSFGDVLGTLQPEKTADWDATVDRVDDAIRQSVEDHLASDVGYAVQLSGGIDSSLVTLLATQKHGERIHSFGLNLGDNAHDESEYRDIVVARSGTLHHEIPVDGKVIADAFPRAVHHMEGPSPHLGCILLMVLCDRVRDVTKVVLTGEGADEFFGGYQRYEGWQKLRQYRRFARMVPGPLWPLLDRYRAIRIYADNEPAIYAGVFADYLELSGMFPALLPKPGARERAAAQFRDFRDKMLAVDQTAYLESLLLRQDKMAMAASVEARVPFTHLPLVRLVNRIPRDIRIPGGVTKPVLKAVAERYFPADFVRRRKVGLTLPLAEWLADPSGLGRYLDLVTDPNSELSRYGDARQFGKLVQRFRQGEGAVARIVVHLINLELWLRDAAGPLLAGPQPRALETQV